MSDPKLVIGGTPGFVGPRYARVDPSTTTHASPGVLSSGRIARVVGAITLARYRRAIWGSSGWSGASQNAMGAVPAKVGSVLWDATGTNYTTFTSFSFPQTVYWSGTVPLVSDGTHALSSTTIADGLPPFLMATDARMAGGVSTVFDLVEWEFAGGSTIIDTEDLVNSADGRFIYWSLPSGGTVYTVYPSTGQGYPGTISGGAVGFVIPSVGDRYGWWPTGDGTQVQGYIRDWPHSSNIYWNGYLHRSGSSSSTPADYTFELRLNGSAIDTQTLAWDGGLVTRTRCWFAFNTSYDVRPGDVLTVWCTANPAALAPGTAYVVDWVNIEVTTENAIGI